MQNAVLMLGACYLVGTGQIGSFAILPGTEVYGLVEVEQMCIEREGALAQKSFTGSGGDAHRLGM